MEIEISDFTGCKIALFCGDKLLTILRDDKSNIPYPNTWELPGGGREGDESPFECAEREVYEELGIHLTEDCLLWSKVYPSMLFEGKESVFLVGKLAQEQFDKIVFGDEGQGYKLMSIEELTEAWLGTAAILPQYQGKGYGSEGLELLEKEFPTIKQWDLCTVLQDAGMVAFYEKNGYRQTHIEPEKEGMDMVYMKKLIDK